MPSGVTKPIPVTTTRLMLDTSSDNAGAHRDRVAERSTAMRFYEAHRILHGDDLFGGIVGDFAPELFFERHDELDGVETVGAQVVYEAGIVGDLGLVDAKMLNDDLFHPIGDVTH
jgi:hypothetical protein